MQKIDVIYRDAYFTDKHPPAFVPAENRFVLPVTDEDYNLLLQVLDERGQFRADTSNLDPEIVKAGQEFSQEIAKAMIDHYMSRPKEGRHGNGVHLSRIVLPEDDPKTGWLYEYDIVLRSGARIDACGCFVPQEVALQGEEAVEEYIIRQELGDHIRLEMSEGGPSRG